jgi:hypothetical protein
VKVAQNNGDFTAKECRVVMKYLFLKGNSAKEMYGMSVTLSDKRPSYCTVKHWVAGFRTGHLSTEDEEHSGRPTEVTVPENVDAIHSKILDDRRISPKDDRRHPGDIRERVGCLRDFRHESSRPNGFPNVSVRFRIVIECLLHKPLWTDCGWILWDF